MMGTFFQDLRYGARTLVKNKGFASMAVVALALGIGANTAIFSVVNAVLFNPLPYAEPGRLIALGQTYPENRATLSTTSYRNFMDWKAQSHFFDGMAAYYTTSFTMTGGNESVRLRGAVLTHDMFSLLGAPPAMGRNFQPEDDLPGGGSEGLPVMLSWEFWQQHFSGDPKVVGQTITLDEKSYTVIGVMPASLKFPVQALPTEVWTSTARDALIKGAGTIMEQRGYRTWRVVARLKSDATLEAAQAEMNSIAADLAAAYPDANADVGVKVMPLLESIVGRLRPTLLLLFGAVGFVLLIACVNVANLLIEHAIKRQKEITVRIALGAQPGNIMRMVLGRGMALTLTGLVIGLVAAFELTQFLSGMLFGIQPTDAKTFVMISLLLVGISLLACYVPARRATKVDPMEALRYE